MSWISRTSSCLREWLPLSRSEPGSLPAHSSGMTIIGFALGAFAALTAIHARDARI
jgi:hypothetical protein